jgi:low affinity Fe/Cu permease
MAFSDFAQHVAQLSGRSFAFGLACIIIAIWAACGPVFHYSDTWQLIINTGTTIITFLMVFLIQNTQNRDTTAIKIQLAELVRATQDARNRFASLDDLTEEQLKMLAARYAALAHRNGSGASRK